MAGRDLHWIVETELHEAAERIASAAADAGHRVTRWASDDEVPVSPGPTAFYGSLTACACMPGVIGDPERLAVSHWLDSVRDIALNPEVTFSTVGQVKELVDQRQLTGSRSFVRPDSPMKEFSGRVVRHEVLSPGALDFGFYFDDATLPIVVAPYVEVLEEWRFIAVERALVASCGYRAQGRTAVANATPNEARALAEVAARRAPEPTVVIDVARHPHGFALVEYNLFSGGDLYDCDVTAVVDAIAESVLRRA